MEFNVILGANPKIVVIAFVEGLRLSKFKESLLKRKSQDLEEVNEWAYKYIRIEEIDKRAEKGRGKRPIDSHGRRSPELKRRSALDRIRAPDRAYSRTDLPRGSAFSSGNVFLEIEDRRLLPLPPR
ncbi:hypothetical protein LIER_12226 [Lithospermum erythrorhizon]|uniref:Uncharacterized protein n=1 Tax=Lithospermum erythrorhizon TaxID=34254 RepID=A0AAV3PS88_LITER